MTSNGQSSSKLVGFLILFIGTGFTSGACFAIPKTNGILSFIFPALLFTDQISYSEGKIRGYSKTDELTQDWDYRKLDKKKKESKSKKSYSAKPSNAPSSMPNQTYSSESTYFNPLEYDIACFSGNESVECGILKKQNEAAENCKVLIAYFCYVKNESENDYLLVEEMKEHRNQYSWDLLEAVEDQESILLPPDRGFPFLDIRELNLCEPKCYQNSLTAKVKLLKSNTEHSLTESFDFCVE